MTLADWQWLRSHCNFQDRATDFAGQSVYSLCTTRAARDVVNSEELREAMRHNAAMRIDALNSSKLAQEGDDDDVGLKNVLHLCRGARVMITSNLDVRLGPCTMHTLACTHAVH